MPNRNIGTTNESLKSKILRRVREENARSQKQREKRIQRHRHQNIEDESKLDVASRSLRRRVATTKSLPTARQGSRNSRKRKLKDSNDENNHAWSRSQEKRPSQSTAKVFKKRDSLPKTSRPKNQEGSVMPTKRRLRSKTAGVPCRQHLKENDRKKNAPKKNAHTKRVATASSPPLVLEKDMAEVSESPRRLVINEGSPTSSLDVVVPEGVSKVYPLTDSHSGDRQKATEPTQNPQMKYTEKNKQLNSILSVTNDKNSESNSAVKYEFGPNIENDTAKASMGTVVKGDVSHVSREQSRHSFFDGPEKMVKDTAKQTPLCSEMSSDRAGRESGAPVRELLNRNVKAKLRESLLTRDTLASVTQPTTTDTALSHVRAVTTQVEFPPADDTPRPKAQEASNIPPASPSVTVSKGEAAAAAKAAVGVETCQVAPVAVTTLPQSTASISATQLTSVTSSKPNTRVAVSQAATGVIEVASTSNTSSFDDDSPVEKPEKIKRPMNAFMIWSREQRLVLSRQNTGMTNAEISIQLGHMWNDLSYDVKQTYFDEANKLKAQHKKDYPDWTYQPRPNKRRHKRETKLSTSPPGPATHMLLVLPDGEQILCPAMSVTSCSGMTNHSGQPTPMHTSQTMPTQNVQLISVQKNQAISAENNQATSYQNVQTSSAQNNKVIPAQSSQATSAQVMPFQNNLLLSLLSNQVLPFPYNAAMSGQNFQSESASKVQKMPGQDVQTLSTQNVKTVSALSVPTMPGQSSQAMPAQSVQIVSVQSATTPVGKNSAMPFQNDLATSGQNDRAASSRAKATVRTKTKTAHTTGQRKNKTIVASAPPVSTPQTGVAGNPAETGGQILYTVNQVQQQDGSYVYLTPVTVATSKASASQQVPSLALDTVNPPTNVQRPPEDKGKTQSPTTNPPQKGQKVQLDGSVISTSFPFYFTPIQSALEATSPTQSATSPHQTRDAPLLSTPAPTYGAPGATPVDTLPTADDPRKETERQPEKRKAAPKLDAEHAVTTTCDISTPDRLLASLTVPSLDDDSERLFDRVMKMTTELTPL